MSTSGLSNNRCLPSRVDALAWQRRRLPFLESSYLQQDTSNVFSGSSNGLFPPTNSSSVAEPHQDCNIDDPDRIPPGWDKIEILMFIGLFLFIVYILYNYIIKNKKGVNRIEPVKQKIKSIDRTETVKQKITKSIDRTERVNKAKRISRVNRTRALENTYSKRKLI